MLLDIVRIGGFSGKTFILFTSNMRIRLVQLDERYFESLATGKFNEASVLVDLPLTMENLQACTHHWDTGKYKPMMISHLGLDTYEQISETD